MRLSSIQCINKALILIKARNGVMLCGKDRNSQAHISLPNNRNLHGLPKNIRIIRIKAFHIL